MILFQAFYEFGVTATSTAAADFAETATAADFPQIAPCTKLLLLAVHKNFGNFSSQVSVQTHGSICGDLRQLPFSAKSAAAVDVESRRSTP
jgi:hypothetical protein